MSSLSKFRRKPGATVVAVRLDLETDGFSYEKWGATQRCRAGDWLVSNEGETYTIDSDTFEQTYLQVSPGVYRKHGHVWAERAQAAGTITTIEGSTAYEPGDWLVYNDEGRSDGIAMSAGRFDSLYEPA